MWLQRKEMGTHIAHLWGRVEGKLIFLMKVLLLSSSSEWPEEELALQPERTVTRILANELVFPFPLWFLPQCHTMPAVIQRNLLLFRCTWV